MSSELNKMLAMTAMTADPIKKRDYQCFSGVFNLMDKLDFFSERVGKSHKNIYPPFEPIDFVMYCTKWGIDVYEP